MHCLELLVSLHVYIQIEMNVMGAGKLGERETDSLFCSLLIMYHHDDSDGAKRCPSEC